MTENRKRAVRYGPVIALVVIGIIGFSNIVYAFINNLTEQIFSSYIDELANHDMQNIQNFVHDRWDILDGICMELREENCNTPEESQMQMQIKNRSKTFERIFLIDEDGDLYTELGTLYPEEQNTLLEFFSERSEHFVVRYDHNDFPELTKEYILYGCSFAEDPLVLPAAEKKFIRIVVAEDIAKISGRIRITSFDDLGFSA